MLLWDVASGQVRQRFEGLEEDAYSVAISPDGTQALAGSIYNQVSVVWDLQTGNKLRTLAGHREGVAAVAWSQDGRRAISGSLDDGLILWDMSSGDAIVVLDAHASDVLAVALAPDGRTALSSGGDGGLIRWDLVDAAEVGCLAGHEDALWDVVFTPDGRQALSASGAVSPNVAVKDASIRLWDLETGAQTRFAALPVDVVMQVAVSPDGATALVGTNEPFIRIWDLPAWQETGRLGRPRRTGDRHRIHRGWHASPVRLDGRHADPLGRASEEGHLPVRRPRGGTVVRSHQPGRSHRALRLRRQQHDPVGSDDRGRIAQLLCVRTRRQTRAAPAWPFCPMAARRSPVNRTTC